MTERGKLLAEERTGQTLSKLLGRIVHDFNNPLAAILGFSDLLRNQNLAPEKRVRYVERIYEQATKLAQLVETMSHFSSSPTPQVASVDFGKTVKEVCSLRGGALESARIALTVEAGETGLMVLAERGAVARILHALLNNVEQVFRENPHLEAQAVSVLCGRDEAGAFVDVLDNGPGVPSELSEEIFEPFFSTRRSGGLGLGLTIARTTAVQMGGTLTLLPGQGAGAGFRLWLPLASPPEKA
jgi:signal transduction histidine kinase